MNFLPEDFISIATVAPQAMCFKASQIANNIAAKYNSQYSKLELENSELKKQLEKLEQEYQAAKNMTDVSINGGPFV